MRANCYPRDSVILLVEASKIRKNLSTLYLAKPRWNAKAVLETCGDVQYLIAIPAQAWTSPDGSRRVMLPDLKTVGT
jgi:hypothetical protein